MSIEIKNSYLEIQYAPVISKLEFRNYCTKNDFKIMVEIVDACKTIDRIDYSFTPEELASYYKHTANFDLFQDVIFAEVNSAPVGYARCFWHTETDGTRCFMHRGFVAPEWRNHGIGTTLLRYVQARMRLAAKENPGEGDEYLDSWASETEKDARNLLVKDGYEPIRFEFEMVRPDLEDIPDLPIPEGLEVRPVNEDQIRKVLEASKEAFRDHWGYSEEDEPTYEQVMDNPNTDVTLWKVAWDGDEVAVMVLSYIKWDENEEYNRLRGYTENIAVRRPWRKRGLASHLISESQKLMKEKGMEEVALGVDTENESGALRLYEKMGYQPVKKWTTFRKALNT